MRAQITAHGVLELNPENETEEYALKKWLAEAAVYTHMPDLNEQHVLRGSKVKSNLNFAYRVTERG